MNAVKIKAKKSVKISFKLISFLFLIVVFYACNQSVSPKEVRAGNTDIAESQKRVYEEIHKQIYENPSAAREKSLAILDTLSNEDRVSKVILLKNIGSSYVFETNYPEAMNYYNKALVLADDIGYYYEIANINNNLGTIYNELGNYKSAFIHFISALDNYDLAGKQQKKNGTLNNIGLTYLNLQNNKKALSFFEKALNTTPQPEDTILTASILNNMAICNAAENKIDAAFENLNRSISLSENSQNQYGLCISYQIMGNIYQDSNQSEKAFEAYSKSLEIARETNLFHQLGVAKIGTARALLSLGDFEEALTIAFDVMDIAEEKNSLVLKIDAHQILANIYEKNEDYKNSFMHFQKFVKDREELTNNTVMNQIYDVELNHLSQLNKTQQLEIDKKELAISKKNTLLFFLSLVFILVLIGLYLAYRNHRHKQNVKLQKTIIELNKKKSNAALEAEIRERKRIGKDLHDSLGYLLSLAGLHASVLQKRKTLTEEKREELLESLLESLDDAFDEVRNISHNLAPSLLSERGLKGVLKNITDRINQSTKLKMSFDTYGLQDKLDSLIENMLYRTIQEIVNNTIKHAEANKLFIQITQDNKEINLIAEDNGKGFDFDSLNDHESFGLSHIKSGIENLNGTLFIDSKLNRGTIISILIPLQ